MDTLKSRLFEGLKESKMRSQVSGEIDCIQESLEVLCKATEELEIRLASVLRQPDPILTEKDDGRKMLVPLAEIIRNLNDTIRQQSIKIKNIIDRVEL